MALYCLCDSEVDGLYKPADMFALVQGTVRMSSKKRAMPCVKTGAAQYIEDEAGRYRHYPNVDIYECQKCGTRIAKES